MRRWLLVVLAALLLGLGAAQLLLDDPGYVLIAWQEYNIEMSVWTGMLLLLAGFVLASLLLQSTRAILALPVRLTRWRNNHSADVTLSRASRGMIALSQGRWVSARKLLTAAGQRADNGLVYLLLAARASHALGETRECEQLLARAAALGGGAASAAALTEAELALSAGQPEKCLAILVQAGNASQYPTGLRMLGQVYRQLEDWQKLRELLPRLKKTGALPGEELAALEVQVYEQLLQRAAVQISGAEAAVAAVWRTVPGRLAVWPGIQLSYARALLAVGASGTAESYIRSALRKNWSDGLASIYGSLRTDQPARQFDHARKWLAGREQNATLLLALGRLALANELWGGAREYFERSLALQPLPETYAELGRLLLRQGQRDAGLEYFQQGLLASAPALPVLPLPR